MAKRVSLTLAEVAYRNLLGGQVGLLAQAKAAKRAAAACTTAVCLAICAARRSEDDWPSQEDYAAYWKVTTRHAQREWAHFRQAFGDDVDVNEVARNLLSNYHARVCDGEVAFASSVPAESVIASLSVA